MEDLVEMDEYRLFPALNKKGKYSKELHKAVIDKIEAYLTDFMKKSELAKVEVYKVVKLSLEDLQKKHPKDDFSLNDLIADLKAETEKLSKLRNELKAKAKASKPLKSSYDEYGVSDVLKEHNFHSEQLVNEITRLVDDAIRYALNTDEEHKLAAITESLCYNRMAEDDYRKFCYRLDKENPDDINKMKSFIQTRIFEIVEGYEIAFKQ